MLRYDAHICEKELVDGCRRNGLIATGVGEQVGNIDKHNVLFVCVGLRSGPGTCSKCGTETLQTHPKHLTPGTVVGKTLDRRSCERRKVDLLVPSDIHLQNMGCGRGEIQIGFFRKASHVTDDERQAVFKPYSNQSNSNSWFCLSKGKPYSTCNSVTVTSCFLPMRNNCLHMGTLPRQRRTESLGAPHDPSDLHTKTTERWPKTQGVHLSLALVEL